MDSKLEQAKEWAWEVTAERIPDTSSGRAKLAAAKVIQSLPDTVVDGDKLREVIAEQYMKIEGSDTKWINAATIESLLTPPLPTLAELIEAGDKPEDYQWMQCDTDEGVGVLMSIQPTAYPPVMMIYPNGRHIYCTYEHVTPRPDLPKLVWPGSHADTITDESVEDAQAGRVADFEPALPRPEDVPAGEAWLVKCGSHEWVGTRESRVEVVCSWALARLDGADYTVASDDEITLISRLVPERKESA